MCGEGGNETEKKTKRGEDERSSEVALFFLYTAKKKKGKKISSMPALITDFVISLDDRYLFLACWLHGEVRQYDIATDTENPRPVSRLEGIGGLLHSENRGGVRRADGAAQPSPVSIRGKRIRGGAQMIQLSLDGKRLYVSSSLFSSSSFTARS